MKTSIAGLALIEQFEGCRYVAYEDGAGILTIGYGHTEGVSSGDVCTQEQARQWLASDVTTAEGAVNEYVSASLNQNQFDALVSFAYNVGAGNLKHSTMLALVNAGELARAADEFLKWDNVAGKPSAGLVRRREAERALFMKGTA